jgi:hypothetical protein
MGTKRVGQENEGTKKKTLALIYLDYPVWRRVRIPPPQSLRVVRGDEKGTQFQMRR